MRTGWIALALVYAGCGGGAAGDDGPDAEVVEHLPAGWTRIEAPWTRIGASAEMLDDHRVLVAGGYKNLACSREDVDIYDLDTGTWTPAAPLTRGRDAFPMYALPGGKVLALGGFDCRVGGQETSWDGEVYDPATDTWTPIPAPPEIPAGDSLWLPDGRLGIVMESSLQAFDPDTFGWEPFYHPGGVGHAAGAAAVVLADGTVMIAGGDGPSGGSIDYALVPAQTPPDTATCPLMPGSACLDYFTAYADLGLLDDGRVLMIGGPESDPSGVWDPQTWIWGPGPLTSGVLPGLFWKVADGSFRHLTRDGLFDAYTATTVQRLEAPPLDNYVDVATRADGSAFVNTATGTYFYAP